MAAAAESFLPQLEKFGPQLERLGRQLGGQFLNRVGENGMAKIAKMGRYPALPNMTGGGGGGSPAPPPRPPPYSAVAGPVGPVNAQFYGGSGPPPKHHIRVIHIIIWSIIGFLFVGFLVSWYQKNHKKDDDD